MRLEQDLVVEDDAAGGRRAEAGDGIQISVLPAPLARIAR